MFKGRGLYKGMNTRRHGSLWVPSLETIYHKRVFLQHGARWGQKRTKAAREGQPDCSLWLRIERDFFRNFVIH